MMIREAKKKWTKENHDDDGYDYDRQPSRATKTRVGFHQLQLLSIRASYLVKTAEILTNKCQLQVTRLLPLLAATFGLVFAVW